MKKILATLILLFLINFIALFFVSREITASWLRAENQLKLITSEKITENENQIKTIEEKDIQINTLLIENNMLKNRVASLQSELFIRSNYYLEVSAYTLSYNECSNDLSNTATMETPKVGWTVAVSRDLKWMLGKKVHIEGVGVRYVSDLMDDRWEKKMDILMPNKKVAQNFGKKVLKIAIIG